MKSVDAAWVLAVTVLLAGCAGQGSLEDVKISEEELVAVFHQATLGSKEENQARHALFEETVAECMTAQGFDYWPSPWRDDPTGGEDPTWNMEYLSKYGYGISTDPPPLVEPDKNLAYAESLPAEEAQAYQDALAGSQAGGLSCEQQAIDAVGAEFGPMPTAPELVVEIESELGTEYGRRVDADPDVTASREGVSDCVVAAGGEPFDPMQASAYDQVEAAWAALQADGRPTPIELAEFQEWETALASAEFRCAAETIELQNEIMDEATREIVSQYRNELETLALSLPTATPSK